MTGIGKIVALILAAGSSVRMGRFKPLLPLGHSTVIEEAITRFFSAGILDVRVVVGHGADAIKPVLNRLGVAWIYNADHAGEMFSSVRAGVNSLAPDVGAFFVLPGDIPLVQPGTIRTLVEAHRGSLAPVVYPCFQGRRGHPPLISANLIAPMRSWNDPGGLRMFLGRFEKDSFDVEVADQAILMDCDNPEDYRLLQARVSRVSIPTVEECRVILNQFGVSLEVFEHCGMVAELARTLAVHLNRAGLRLNLELIAASGWLHDLAKGQSNHANTGALILTELGYPEVAEVVACHTDIPHPQSPLDAAQLVYLADKLVEGTRLVSLDERFSKALRRCAFEPSILEAVRRRLKDARIILARVEGILGMPLDRIAEKYLKSMASACIRDEKRIYLVRHGEIEGPGNAKRYIGQLDLPLAEEGIRQAQHLREELLRVPLGAIYCSDLQRAVDTAEIIGQPHQLKPRALKELREIHLGHWQGLKFEDVRLGYPAQFQERGRDIVHFRPAGGESFLDCSFRVIPTLYQLLQSTRGDILIVGHAGVNRIILCQALGMSLEKLFEIEQDYGCLNLIHFRNLGFELMQFKGKVA